jgi:hypothetical protein
MPGYEFIILTERSIAQSHKTGPVRAHHSSSPAADSPASSVTAHSAGRRGCMFMRCRPHRERAHLPPSACWPAAAVVSRWREEPSDRRGGCAHIRSKRGVRQVRCTASSAQVRGRGSRFDSGGHGRCGRPRCSRSASVCKSDVSSERHIGICSERARKGDAHESDPRGGRYILRDGVVVRSERVGWSAAPALSRRCRSVRASVSVRA